MPQRRSHLDVAAKSKKAGNMVSGSNMAHEILEAILSGLNQWREPQMHEVSPTGQYIADQSAIGWDWFLDGWLAKSWRMSQEKAWQGVRS